jgi:hypothetical protein
MHSSRLRLGPSQSRPLTDASPGSARSPGLRVYRAAPSHRRNIRTHAPFRTECQSFLRFRDMRLTISRKQRSDHAAALRRQRPQVRILSGAPMISISYTKHVGVARRCGYHMATESGGPRPAAGDSCGEKRKPFVGPKDVDGRAFSLYGCARHVPLRSRQVGFRMMTKPAHCRWCSTSAQRRSSPMRRSPTSDCDRRSIIRGRPPCPFRFRTSRPPCPVTSARAARASMPSYMTRFLLISGSKVRALVRPPSK